MVKALEDEIFEELKFKNNVNLIIDWKGGFDIPVCVNSMFHAYQVFKVTCKSFEGITSGEPNKHDIFIWNKEKIESRNSLFNLVKHSM
jgi:hypothetical protein